MKRLQRRRLKGNTTKKRVIRNRIILFFLASFYFSALCGACSCLSAAMNASEYSCFSETYGYSTAYGQASEELENSKKSNTTESAHSTDETSRNESDVSSDQRESEETSYFDSEETSHFDLEDIPSGADSAKQEETFLAEQETSLTLDDELEYIEEHPELYPAKLISFAEEYPQAISFVYNYPTESQKDWEESERELSAQECLSDEVPTLYQWDERWGYNTYGAGYIGTSGCGPVCLSMAALYLTKNPDNTPSAIASYAEENGYYVEGAGTAWSLMEQGCTEFGIASHSVDVNEDELAHALTDGHPVICSVKAGDFTNRGHFIVLASYDDGLFTVHDPNSPENTEKRWTFSELAWQIRKAWKFYEIE